MEAADVGVEAAEAADVEAADAGAVAAEAVGAEAEAVEAEAAEAVDVAATLTSSPGGSVEAAEEATRETRIPQRKLMYLFHLY